MLFMLDNIKITACININMNIFKLNLVLCDSDLMSRYRSLIINKCDGVIFDVDVNKRRPLYESVTNIDIIVKCDYDIYYDNGELVTLPHIMNNFYPIGFDIINNDENTAKMTVIHLQNELHRLSVEELNRLLSYVGIDYNGNQLYLPEIII